MANEHRRTFEERERLARQVILEIVRKLKAGTSVEELQSEPRYTDRLIRRAVASFERSSFKPSKGDSTLKCKCGSKATRLNVFGQCYGCEVRRNMGVRC